MNNTLETNNQQPSVLRNKDEGSETIPKGSREEIPEAVSILTSNVEDKDIVHKSKAFEKYMNKANQMFNNKFDYSKFIYVNAKTKGIIICPIHGEYYQNMDKHTAKNSNGCPQCWNRNRPYPKWLSGRDIVPFETFIEKATKVFQNKYSYVEESYNGLTSKITVICKEHGEFNTTPHNFLKSAVGCPKCARKSAANKMTDSYNDFITQAKHVHNNKYEYLNENEIKYVNKKSLVKIKCKEHGVFTKKAQKHLAGQGCFKCKINQLIKDNILVGGYSEDLFMKKPELKLKDCKLYLLKVGDLYKVGITTKNVNNRVNALKSKARAGGENVNFTILNLKDGTLYDCFKLEQQILKDNDSERVFKTWSTELLKNIEIEKYF